MGSRGNLGSGERRAGVWQPASLLILWPCCCPGITGVDMLPYLSLFILAGLMSVGGRENSYKS